MTIEDPSVRPTPDTWSAPLPRLHVAFVNTHPIQYFAPLYAYLGEHAGINVTALYLSDFSLRGGHDRGFGTAITWDIDLLAGYEAQFMGKAAASRRIGGFFSMVGPELWSAIVNGNFDAVIIHGHNLAAHHVALAASKFSHTAVFARSETHSRLVRSGWKNMIRGPLMSTWYKAFDGFLAIGSANARYYESAGVPPERIFRVPYTVDNSRFMTASNLTFAARVAARARLGLREDAPAILYAAKFDARKRPSDLLEAFNALQKDGVVAQLVMAGSGALGGELRRMVAESGIANVSFPGFVNQAELPRIYAACDVFVLPSQNEPWGLAVNEAMCAGLPVVISEEVGCAADLVINRVNGMIFPAGDVGLLAAALRPLLTDPVYRAKCGAASLERIGQWSYRECGEGLRQAILSAHRRPSVAANMGGAK